MTDAGSGLEGQVKGPDERDFQRYLTNQPVFYFVRAGPATLPVTLVWPTTFVTSAP
ncbi:hypothetical protein COMA1_30137 [Candidatus Nitrospira nitrosa]|uniref:Uncharacterized protein n=1 Tax=Candidatus Nitrospira nitrosa TaxID=1742972 RepID=A0A0S4LND2_9BACT|nr:hypothetical protein COMA1_30137 [Candidatus Nitrospira nitrosa]